MNKKQSYINHDIEKMMNDPNLSDLEKFNIMKQKTNHLEERASHEEQLMHVLGTHSDRNVEKSIEVNDMYIESIKAKLMMLDNI